MSIDKLIKAYQDYCKIKNLPLISADEQINLNQDDQEWIANYIRVWDLTQSIEQDQYILDNDQFIQSLKNNGYL